MTLNRNASIGKCCHIITNSDNKWLLVLKFHRYWFCRDPYFWFRGACTKKIDNFRIRREKRLALRKRTCSTELRTPIERYKLSKLLKEKSAGLIPSSDKKNSCKGKLRSHFKLLANSYDRSEKIQCDGKTSPLQAHNYNTHLLW